MVSLVAVVLHLDNQVQEKPKISFTAYMSPLKIYTRERLQSWLLLATLSVQSVTEKEEKKAPLGLATHAVVEVYASPFVKWVL